MSLLIFTAVLLAALVWSPIGVRAQEQPCWIQEVHYEDMLVDNNEFIEIACREGTDISGWTLHLYRHSFWSRRRYATFDLSELSVTDTRQGLHLYVLTRRRIHKGGAVLVDGESNIVEFVSYGGPFIASNGIAAGQTALDVGFAESRFGDEGLSLQLAGSGCTRNDFVWQFPNTATMGAINIGQVYSCSLIPSAPPTNRPTVTDIPSAQPSMAPSECSTRCYFSCFEATAVPDCGGQTSGLFDICPEGPEGDIMTVYCDQETAGGGWMLLYSYNHKSGENFELVDDEIPTDPDNGYSHFTVNQTAGYTLTDVVGVRLFCRTSAHNRTVHFTNFNTALRRIAWNGDQVDNAAAVWREDSNLLPDHTANLPLATVNTNNGNDGGFAEFPFWRGEFFHWAIRGAAFRWECDDFAFNPFEDTVHNVWVRIKGLSLTDSPSTAPSVLPTPLPSLFPSVHPSGVPSISPSSLPSAFPTQAPTECVRLCFFSCTEAVSSGCTGSGIYEICPTGALGPTTSVYCDQVAAGGGWMLQYAYSHIGGENAELVPETIPLDPFGYSHFFINQIVGYAPEDIEEVRFFCNTTAHNRTISFYSSSLIVRRMAWDGDQSINVASAWNITNTTVLLDDHNANLPLSTTNVDTDVDGGFNRFPYFTVGQYHWGIRAIGERWECDDFTNNFNSTTLHQVWVRILL